MHYSSHIDAIKSVLTASYQFISFNSLFNFLLIFAFQI
ncbi:hypothetical protein PTUN_b0236 [Pseudoalteromonas tunicata]|nr:hypothetical protein PTUN_b0236 [Pseudoalteromonas tunicata]